MITELEDALANVRKWSPLWHHFYARHGQWFEARCAEGPEVFSVPCFDEHAYRLAFGTHGTDLAAEKAFVVLCRKFNCIGLRALSSPDGHRQTEFINFGGIEIPESANDDWVEAGRELGWTNDQVCSAKRAVGKANGIAPRMAACAGRLVCSPAFIDGRAKLRELWEALPRAVRPPFPLRARSFVADPPTKKKSKALPVSALPFLEAFRDFCSDWAIDGFETWDLPVPSGPQWPDLRSGVAQGTSTGSLTTTTPWHFPALDTDDLGQLAMYELKVARQSRGIDDTRSWKTYAELFRIDFWERVLMSRYADCRRQGRVGQIEALLAVLLKVSPERVERLRKQRRALQTGRRKSLGCAR